MEPNKFTRGYLALSDQEAAKDSALNTYHINGMEVSEDPAEAVEALEIEIANIRYAYPKLEPSSHCPDAESAYWSEDDPDSDIADLSAISSISGEGDPQDEPIGDMENAAAEFAYYNLRHHRKTLRSFQPKGHKHGYRTKRQDTHSKHVTAKAKAKAQMDTRKERAKDAEELNAIIFRINTSQTQRPAEPIHLDAMANHYDVPFATVLIISVPTARRTPIKVRARRKHTWQKLSTNIYPPV